MKRENNIKIEALKARFSEIELKLRETDGNGNLILDYESYQRRLLQAEWSKIYDELKTLSYEPEEGMGATIGWNGDAYPYTIHKVSDDLKKVWATEDEYKVVGGPYSYGTERFPVECTPTYKDDQSKWSLYILRKNGRYVRKGCKMNDPWGTLQLGHRSYAQNPSF